MGSDSRTINVESLQVPPALKKEIKQFCDEIVKTCEGRIISITAVGSATTADFISGMSDVNILVVFSQLDLQDLNPVAPKACAWWRRSKLSPRFISKRNLMSSLEYFPIDFWTMQRSRTVLYGEDVLKDVVIDKEDLLWQLRHEAKGLRMRMKQQYWRTANDVRFARSNLIMDFNTIMYLLKVLLYLKGASVPETADRLISSARQELKIENTSTEILMMIKKGAAKLRKENICVLYGGLMEYIRAIDDVSTNASV